MCPSGQHHLEISCAGDNRLVKERMVSKVRQRSQVKVLFKEQFLISGCEGRMDLSPQQWMRSVAQSPRYRVGGVGAHNRLRLVKPVTLALEGIARQVNLAAMVRLIKAVPIDNGTLAVQGGQTRQQLWPLFRFWLNTGQPMARFTVGQTLLT